MITETDSSQERNDDRATWLWAVLVSGFVNLLAAMLISWGISLRMVAIQVAQEHPEETFMVTSSSIHIAQHSHPIPQQRNPQPIVAQRQQQRKSAKKEAATPQPTAEPTELAKIVPNAPPQPKAAPKKHTAGSLAEQLAQQQVAFQHETQQLNSQNNPVSVATIDPNARDSAMKSYRMNFSGNQELEGKGEGFVMPLQRYIGDDGQHCYYVQYEWLYPTGGTEVGNVPWPFCYPPNGDLIGRGLRHIPFQPPQPGFHLPAGFDLQPIERDVYRAWLAAGEP